MAREIPNPADASEGESIKVQSDGTLGFGAVGNFVSSDGSEHTIYIQSTEPANPSEGDIWIDTS